MESAHEVTAHKQKSASMMLRSVALIFSSALAVHAQRPIDQIEHVIIFMQENRAYDHYYGMHAGVRGFNDRTAIQLPSGLNSFYQPVNQSDLTQYMLPFHTDSMSTSAQCMPAPTMDYPHDIGIINEGRFDSWNTARAAGMGMAHWNRSDLPYYYKLYESFVAGDQYFQSTYTMTNPNRLHLFSGSNGLSVGELPVLTNDEPNPGWTWETMSETLESAGISWKTYQEADNFDDNGNAWFASFQKAQPGSPLFDKGMKRSVDLIQDLDKDMAAGALPSVSWIVGPTNVSEHATWHPAAGEDFTARILATIQKYPDVYAKTAIILNYDEGGQFYDHHWAPNPPLKGEGLSTVTTTGEDFLGQPIGPGFRVPFLVISPWSRGNIVLSETLDHTSVLKLLEIRFNVTCRNISPWRRAITGDITNAFDWGHPDFSWPSLPDTSDYVQKAAEECADLPAPSVPAEQSFPVPETGTRISRALPYEFLVVDGGIVDGLSLPLTINNTGAGGAAFLLLNAAAAGAVVPRKYAVEGGKFVAEPISLAPGARNGSRYALALHGPNGFVRQFGGDVDDVRAPALAAALAYAPAAGNVLLRLAYATVAGAPAAATFTITDNAYGAAPLSRSLTAPATLELPLPVCAAAQGCWYDLTVSVDGDAFQRRFMGRMETGVDTISDPAMAAGKPANGPGVDSVRGLDAQPSRSTRHADHPLLPDHARFFVREEPTHKDAQNVWAPDEL